MESMDCAQTYSELMPQKIQSLRLRRSHRKHVSGPVSFTGFTDGKDAADIRYTSEAAEFEKGQYKCKESHPWGAPERGRVDEYKESTETKYMSVTQVATTMKVLLNQREKLESVINPRKNEKNNPVTQSKRPRVRKSMTCDECGVTIKNIWRQMINSHDMNYTNRKDDVVTSGGYVTYICPAPKKGAPTRKC
ncbi:unnamed protein product [Mytilus edulis]|uniref:Uncharacterized protein n=1 Tax=Mytilus edulis TaxID=6550 RepID=A0A8S3TK31_MYTED|nr:unnamed protein product [Mytilus edulis]